MASHVNTLHHDFTRHYGLVDVEEELLILVEIAASGWVIFEFKSPLAASRTY
jgi:hypothetical protein